MKLRERIMDACKTAISKGLTIKGGEWGVRQRLDGSWAPDGGGAVCPLGALLLAEPPIVGEDSDENLTVAAAIAVERSRDWVSDFINVVDQRAYARYDEEAFGIASDVMTAVAKGEWALKPLVPEREDAEPTEEWARLDAMMTGGRK